MCLVFSFDALMFLPIKFYCHPTQSSYIIFLSIRGSLTFFRFYYTSSAKLRAGAGQRGVSAEGHMPQEKQCILLNNVITSFSSGTVFTSDLVTSFRKIPKTALAKSDIHNQYNLHSLYFLESMIFWGGAITLEGRSAKFRTSTLPWVPT